MGTLAMGLTTGSAFGLAYVGTLTVVFVLIVFFAATIQGRSAFARSRRWTAYIACWFTSYAAAGRRTWRLRARSPAPTPSGDAAAIQSSARQSRGREFGRS